MKKIVILAFLMFFLISLTSAGYYNYEKKIYLDKDVYADNSKVYYDNNQRHPVYDYRHGYSYRFSRDFKDSYRRVKLSDSSFYDKYYNYKYLEGKKDYYYQYDSFWGDYDKVGCYRNPPSNKLFYRKCP